MNNIFPLIEVHKRYDLKGSTYGRISTEEERKDSRIALKDLDFLNSDSKIRVGPTKKKILLE